MKKLLLPTFMLASLALSAQTGGTGSEPNTLPNEEPVVVPFNVNSYPNPADEVLEITSSLTQSTDLWVTVHGSNGQIISRELWGNNGNGFNGRINTGGIPGGLYTIHLSDGSNSVFKRIVIVH